MSSDAEEIKRTHEEQKEYLKELTSLKQNPRARLILLVNLVVVCAVAVFLFIFFSVPDGGPTAPTITYGKNLTNLTS